MPQVKDAKAKVKQEAKVATAKKVKKTFDLPGQTRETPDEVTARLCFPVFNPYLFLPKTHFPVVGAPQSTEHATPWLSSRDLKTLHGSLTSIAPVNANPCQGLSDVGSVKW